MREILFRGKTDKGEWIVGSLVTYYDGSTSVVEATKTGILFHVASPETIGQYTGLTDKNGKPIFEGDIVIAPIYYDVGCYPHTESKIISVKIPEIYKMSVDGNFEIIGNIHDNPELLKGGEG